MDLPKIAGIGSEYFLLGFFLFIAFYIIVRLLAERHEHGHKKKDNLEHLDGLAEKKDKDEGQA